MMARGERLQTAIQLWILDDYFFVENLCDDIHDFLDGHIVPRILESARLGDLSVDIKDWAAAGRLVYGTLPEATSDHCLRENFLDITFGHPDLRKEIVQTPEFKALCSECRDFGSDSMLRLLDDNAIVPK
ncbi:hypothetical protein LY76DRAFT_599498 [Colletotrichum caudatum]|nr:hypothetical protein LY76DRAFT_599498 [Colletotrichum caudatum]